MATDGLACRGSEELLSASVVENTRLRLGELVFHDVGRGGLTEVVDVVELGNVVRVLSLTGA